MGRVDLLFLMFLVKSLLNSNAVYGRSLPGENIEVQDSDSTDLEIVLKKPFDVDDFLEKYGYLVPPEPDSGGGRPTYHEDTRVNAIKTFQRFSNLNETGSLNNETITQMKKPRCGVPDILPSTDLSQPQNFFTATKWSKSSLLWRIQTYSNKLSQEVQRTAFERAFNHWAAASGLTIVQTHSENDTADIIVKFARGNHGDGIKNAFDGRGQILAHAYFPEDGRAHFDEDELWVYHTNNGSELETVATHELGHSLGLAHSPVRGSVMSPFSFNYRENFALHADDIAGIQSLYGAPPTTTTTAPSDKVKPKKNNKKKKKKKNKKKKDKESSITSSSNKTDLCNVKFDAITRSPDDTIHLFIGKNLYELEDYCQEGYSCVKDGYPVPIRKVYKRGPSKVTAAAYLPDHRRRTYLFKGKKVWRFTKYKLDKGYPKKLNSSVLPHKPTAAYVQKNQFADYQLYLFGSKYFWELNLYTETMANQKMLVNTYWDHVPKRPDAIFQTISGHIYIFKGKHYRKYDHLRDDIQRKKPIAPAWIGGKCGFSDR